MNPTTVAIDPLLDLPDACVRCAGPLAPGLIFCRRCDFDRAVDAARYERAANRLFRHYVKASATVARAELIERSAQAAHLLAMYAYRDAMHARQAGDATVRSMRDGVATRGQAAELALLRRAERLGKVRLMAQRDRFAAAIKATNTARERLRRVNFSNQRRQMAAADGRFYEGV